MDCSEKTIPVVKILSFLLLYYIFSSNLCSSGVVENIFTLSFGCDVFRIEAPEADGASDGPDGVVPLRGRLRRPRPRRELLRQWGRLRTNSIRFTSIQFDPALR